MKNRHSEGFTLIEVMVALTIIALSMSATITASNESSRRLGHLEKKTFAHWIAQNEIGRVLTGERGMSISAGMIQGTTFLAGENWRWQIDITNYDKSSLLLNAQVFEGNDQNPIDALETYVHNYNR